MSAFGSDRLYNLLPALYRIRDVDQGEPLRALLAILEKELDALDADVAGLYENWFIETCQEWVVPYIGDLLGVRGLKPIADGTFTARPYVAHTLRYRRRKGTAAMLEQLARDTTNWPAARVVEFFQFLDTTQYLNHLRPKNVATPDLRDTNALELLGGPLEQTNHTLEIRSPGGNGGKYNVLNLGIYLWRLTSYPLTRTTPRPASDGSDGRYRFNPLGLDVPLFNHPPAPGDRSRVTAESQVPGALRRRALYDDLEALHQAFVDGKPNNSLYFAEKDPVVAVWVSGKAIRPEQIVICDLSDLPSSPGSWRQPPAVEQYNPSSDNDKPPSKRTVVPLPIAVSIDPLLGRLAFTPPFPTDPAQVLVSYSYGFSGNLGGGPYERIDALPKTPPDGKRLWTVTVTKEGSAKLPETFATLAAAISDPKAGWNVQPRNTLGTISILDSQTYADIPAVTIPEGSQLVILALGSGGRQEPGRHVRPHIRGGLQVSGKIDATGETAGTLILNGLLLDGTLTVNPGNLGSLQLLHCTLAPGGGGIQASDNPALKVILSRTICGPLSLNGAAQLTVEDSIIDAGDGAAIQAATADASIQTSTVFGATGSSDASGVRTLLAGNSIFTGPVFAERRQSGCVRFCSVARDSRTPRRYRCQPDLALKSVDDAQAQAAIRGRLMPTFTSITYGQPGYAQLSGACAPEISAGAEDGSEMGAFDFIKQPQREDNLRASLEEYLRFGLAAGVFFVT
jgi:hypothetical protein